MSEEHEDEAAERLQSAMDSMVRAAIAGFVALLLFAGAGGLLLFSRTLERNNQALSDEVNELEKEKHSLVPDVKRIKGIKTKIVKLRRELGGR